MRTLFVTPIRASVVIGVSQKQKESDRGTIHDLSIRKLICILSSSVAIASLYEYTHLCKCISIKLPHRFRLCEEGDLQVYRAAQ